MSIYNPAGLDTDRPAIKVRRLTDIQVAEMVQRLEVTAETEDLTDWGWLDGRTLCILDEPAALNDAIESEYSDIRTCLAIAESNAADGFGGPRDVGFLVSMRSLVRKVEAAVAEQATRPPVEVDGTPVAAMLDRPHEFRGEVWFTLVPEDETDERLWEWSRTTGRVVQTMP